MFISGQPTERGLRDLRAQGVTTVVNLRSPEEMSKRVPFDEAALVKELGMEYVYLPMRGTPEFPYSPAAVKSFAAAMSSAKGKVLLHCTIAWRASHMCSRISVSAPSPDVVRGRSEWGVGKGERCHHLVGHESLFAPASAIVRGEDGACIVSSKPERVRHRDSN